MLPQFPGTLYHLALHPAHIFLLFNRVLRILSKTRHSSEIILIPLNFKLTRDFNRMNSDCVITILMLGGIFIQYLIITQTQRGATFIQVVGTGLSFCVVIDRFQNVRLFPLLQAHHVT
jgi:hypothetical protein